jgi:predicted ATP-grasp superfamily ATP-dependent carboligase
MTKTVLVTDGEQRAALAIVRSLGRAGYEVYVCSVRAASIAGASRYSSGSYKVSDPLRRSESFLLDLEEIVATTHIDVLIPVSEAALLVVLPNRNKFKCAIPFATATSFDQVCDKRRVLEAAKPHNISVPDQTVIADPMDASVLEDTLRFPIVLKPARSVAGKGGERVRAGVTYAATPQKLREELNHVPHNAYPVLLQQRIEGPGFGISVLVWEGELVAAFAHRRIREKPPSGGVSVLRESIPLDRTLLSRSVALLNDLQWKGVAMVEYKLDNSGGIPYLMEINGRFWGSLQLAVDAGVDFPKLLVELALAERPSPVTTYEIGVRSRWEWGDADHLLARILHPASPRPESWTSGMKQRFRAFVEFVQGFSHENVAEVFRRDDPQPFFRETLDWICRR